MPRGPHDWRKFLQEDGTTVSCLMAGEYLERVVVEDEEGNSLAIPPEMVNIEVIAEALGFRPKLH